MRVGRPMPKPTPRLILSLSDKPVEVVLVTGVDTVVVGSLPKLLLLEDVIATLKLNRVDVCDRRELLSEIKLEGRDSNAIEEVLETDEPDSRGRILAPPPEHRNPIELKKTEGYSP
jgi:hypothetical protein